jgi:hypothetical protein
MHKVTVVAATAGLVIGPAFALSAQPVSQRGASDRSASAELRETMRLRDARYQIGQMERLLEGAVEHGAGVIRDRLRALMPGDMLLAENVRARGFRLEGYGVFFDVEVPPLQGTLPWSFRTLDQNDLGLENALRTLRSFIDGAASNDVNLQQAFKRLELQVAPISTALMPPASSTDALLAGGPTRQVNAPPPNDPILKNPNEAYHVQVRDALVDAMLEHSRGLNLAATEWLTVAARRIDDRVRLAPVDTDARTVIIRVGGADLAAFLAGQITRDEARNRVDVREY